MAFANKYQQGFDVLQLYDSVSDYMQKESLTPPVYRLLGSLQDGIIVPIRLYPGSPESPPRHNIALEGPQPRLLISVHLSGDTLDGEQIEAIRSALKAIPFQSYECKIHAAFKSSSTILIVNIPTWLWACINYHPAIKKIGWVEPINLCESALDRENLVD